MAEELGKFGKVMDDQVREVRGSGLGGGGFAGEDKNADCAGLIATARAQGAPPKGKS